MWALPRPPHTASQTFTTCISRVQDQDLKARLGRATQAVADASTAYDAAGARQRIDEITREALVGGEVTTEEMSAVYTQRMAHKGAPGRSIYDDLILAPSHGRCPLCGHRTVTTLDHHLPKAHYPALAVAPLNLVPSCGDCNKAKLDKIPQNAEEVSLHPYFDSVDGERWLRADVIETQPAALRFRVDAPNTWALVLRRRVLNHFNTLGLATLYTTQAAEELLNIQFQLVDLRDSAGLNAVRAELWDRALSCSRARRNGWRTAAYEAWSASDWFSEGGFAAS